MLRKTAAFFFLALSLVFADEFKIDGIRFAFSGGYTELQTALNSISEIDDYPTQQGSPNASYPIGGSIDLKGSWSEYVGINTGVSYVYSAGENLTNIPGEGGVKGRISQTLIYGNLLLGKLLRKGREGKVSPYIGAGVAMGIMSYSLEGPNGLDMSTSDIGEGGFNYTLVGGLEYLAEGGYAPFFELVYFDYGGLGFNIGVGFLF